MASGPGTLIFHCTSLFLLQPLLLPPKPAAALRPPVVAVAEELHLPPSPPLIPLWLPTTTLARKLVPVRKRLRAMPPLRRPQPLRLLLQPSTSPTRRKLLLWRGPMPPPLVANLTKETGRHPRKPRGEEVEEEEDKEQAQDMIVAKITGMLQLKIQNII